MERNVIAPNAEEPAKLLKLVARWDYRRTVERLRPRVEKWASLTAEMVREFYIAHKSLSGQKGQRKDPSAPDYIQYTWRGFCEEVGVSPKFIAGFVRRFIPGELAENGEDKLYSLEEWNSLSPPEPPLATREEERLIARFMHTGERPDGWNKGLERIARERKEAQRAKEFSKLWLDKFTFETRRDYFADIRMMAGKNKKFRLQNQAQAEAQTVMFRAIHEYFGLFERLPDLMAAAANLSEKVHVVFNYFAELLVDKEEAE